MILAVCLHFLIWNCSKKDSICGGCSKGQSWVGSHGDQAREGPEVRTSYLCSSSRSVLTALVSRADW